MQIIKRGKIVYYIKAESIIVGINSFQYVAYTVYLLQNRKPFYDFKEALLSSSESEYANALEMMRLAEKYKLKGMATKKPI